MKLLLLSIIFKFDIMSCAKTLPHEKFTNRKLTENQLKRDWFSVFLKYYPVFQLLRIFNWISQRRMLYLLLNQFSHRHSLYGNYSIKLFRVAISQRVRAGCQCSSIAREAVSPLVGSRCITLVGPLAKRWKP